MSEPHFFPDEVFQFTRPAWGATVVSIPSSLCSPVSIHAPRVGRDTARRGLVGAL